MPTTTDRFNGECLLAVEVLLWQLVKQKIVDPEPLAAQLNRYAKSLGTGGAASTLSPKWSCTVDGHPNTNGSDDGSTSRVRRFSRVLSS